MDFNIENQIRAGNIWDGWAGALDKAEKDKIFKWLNLIDKDICSLREGLIDERVLEKVKERIVQSSQKDIVTECLNAIKDVCALQINYQHALQQLQRQQLEFEEKQKQWDIHYEKQKKEIDQLRLLLGYEDKFIDKGF